MQCCNGIKREIKSPAVWSVIRKLYLKIRSNNFTSLYYWSIFTWLCKLVKYDTLSGVKSTLFGDIMKIYSSEVPLPQKCKYSDP